VEVHLHPIDEHLIQIDLHFAAYLPIAAAAVGETILCKHVLH